MQVRATQTVTRTICHGFPIGAFALAEILLLKVTLWIRPTALPAAQ